MDTIAITIVHLRDCCLAAADRTPSLPLPHELKCPSESSPVGITMFLSAGYCEDASLVTSVPTPPIPSLPAMPRL